jgi:isoamylase
MKNMMTVLMMSQGTPMILSGDEYAQTRHGNNNWYGHDNEMTQFDWSELAAQQDWFAFYQGLIKFRTSCPLLGRDEFLSKDCITWHENNWDDPTSKFLAFTLHDRLGEYEGDLYCAINSHHFEVTVNLPRPRDGETWCRIIDTNLPSPRDFVPGGNAGVEGDYRMQSHSVIVLVSKAV